MFGGSGAGCALLSKLCVEFGSGFLNPCISLQNAD